MKRNRCRYTAVLSMAVVLAAAAPLQSFAEEMPAEEYVQDLERLQDNHMEYDELADLIKNYYGPIKSAYDMMEGQKMDNGTIASSARVMADDLLSQAEVMEDVAEEQSGMEQIISKETAKALRKSAKQLRSTAASTDRSIEKKSSAERQLDRQVNSLVMTVQSLMNQYEQLLSQRTIVAKAVELSEAADSLQKTMQSQGLAVDGDVLSAAASLSSSRYQLASLDAGIDQLHKMLCSFTGWGNDGNPEIGPVPSADIAFIDTIDVNADKEKAVNNNYDLISLRGQTGGGMTDFQIRTSKTTTQTANKLRNVEYSENTLRSDIQTLYDTVLEKKASYDSALTAWQSAQMTWQAAQIQRQNGSFSQIEYLQQELAYLQAQSGYKCADLSLQQAIQNYKWAVAGVTVSVS